MAVYLIHFETNYHHARHYLGWTNNVERRVTEHKNNMGARLLEVINEAGIAWEVVRIWHDGDRTLERRLKDRHKASQLCPVCRAQKGLPAWPL